MAHVNNFIYCLNSNTNEVEANALGVLSAITPEYVPGTFSFSILCSILDLEEGNHDISIQFIDPSEDVLVNIEGTTTYKKTKDTNLPKEYLGINISSNWQNVVLKESGVYYSRVAIDGENCGKFEIYVKGKNEGERCIR